MTGILENETLTEVNDGIRLIQDPAGHTFGTDALMLAAFVKREPSARAAELGSGSGIVSLLLASRRKFSGITAIEVQPYYAGLTRRNAELNGLDGMIETVNADIREWSGCADIFFSNPPYMRADCGTAGANDGRYAARHEVNGTIAELVSAVSSNLKYGGRFYCVYRPDRLTELLTSMSAGGIEPKRMVFVHGDARHEPCLVLVEGKKGAGRGCRVLRPLFLSEPDGSASPDARYIYENGDWPE